MVETSSILHINHVCSIYYKLQQMKDGAILIFHAMRIKMKEVQVNTSTVKVSITSWVKELKVIVLSKETENQWMILNKISKQNIMEGNSRFICLMMMMMMMMIMMMIIMKYYLTFL